MRDKYPYFQECLHNLLSKIPESYDYYMGLSLMEYPELDKQMSLTEKLNKVNEIYYIVYWNGSIDEISELISPLQNRETNNMLKNLIRLMFETAVEMGVLNSRKLLQGAINTVIEDEQDYLDYKQVELLRVDGVIGTVTLMKLMQWIKYGVIPYYKYLCLKRRNK